MFNQIFKRSHAVMRQLNAPLLEARQRYLAHRAAEDAAPSVIREIAYYQLIIMKYLGLNNDDRIITFKEIDTAAKLWARHETRRFGFNERSCYLCKIRFRRNATKWLCFLSRLEIRRPSIPSQITDYVDYMRNEKNLSEITIYNRCYLLQKFFSQIKGDPGKFLADLTPARLDDLYIQELRRGAYSRATIKNRVTVLRIFFHYAECRGLCRSGIADSIQMPRFYKHGALPSGPALEDIQRLLKTTEGDHPSNIRDRAIILLLAVYGLRGGEVRQLRLENFDWVQKTFRLQRLKLGPAQQFPLVQTAEKALKRYLKVRPRCSNYQELFLTLTAPYRPIKNLVSVVSLRWKKLNIPIKNHGTHSLRHACATRLINQGVSLKTIADQLGHRDLETTRIYAKVDLSRLREVANFNLGGVL